MTPEEQQKAMEALSKSVGESITPIVTKAAVDAAVKAVEEMPALASLQKSEEDNRKAHEEKAIGYFKGVVNGDRGEVRKHAKALAGNEGTAGEGQEWAPEYFEGQIVEVAPKYGLVRQKAQKVPLAGRKVTWPTGGEVEAFKVDELGNYKARKPASGSFIMEPEKLGVLIPVSKELIEDNNLTLGLINYLNTVAGRAFAKLEDAMAFGLDGSSSGEGIFKKTGVPEKVIAGTAFTDVTFEELLEGTELLDDDVEGNIEWIMSRSFRNILLSKRLEVGTDLQEFIFGNPGAGQPRTLWDYPMTLHRSMPKRTDSDPETHFTALCSWDNVYFGDRRQYKVELSDVATIKGTDDNTLIHAFMQDIVVLKFSERVDIELANHTKAFARFKTAADES